MAVDLATDPGKHPTELTHMLTVIGWYRHASLERAYLPENTEYAGYYYAFRIRRLLVRLSGPLGQKKHAFAAAVRQGLAAASVMVDGPYPGGRVSGLALVDQRIPQWAILDGIDLPLERRRRGHVVLRERDVQCEVRMVNHVTSPGRGGYREERVHCDGSFGRFDGNSVRLSIGR